MTMSSQLLYSNKSHTTLQTHIYKYLTPIDLALALYIILQNSVILYDYYPDRRRVSSLLFLLIAGADVITAASQLVRGTVATVCLRDETFSLQSWIFLLYITPGLLSYISSIFFSVVLTILKTINIINPFYRVNQDLLKSALVLVPTFALFVSILDMVFWHQHFQRDPITGNGYKVCTVGQERAYDNLIFIGGGVVMRIMDLSFISSGTLYDSLTFILLSCEYVVPCGIVLVCMVVQMVYVSVVFGSGCKLRRSLGNHVNLTVFLISVLFLVCNGSFALCFFLFYIYQVDMELYDDPRYSVEMVAKFTFPLLTAALFPTIIILRKPDLRIRYKGYIAAVLSGLMFLCRAVRRMCTRNSGYSTI